MLQNASKHLQLYVFNSDSRLLFIYRNNTYVSAGISRVELNWFGFFQKRPYVEVQSI